MLDVNSYAIPNLEEDLMNTNRSVSRLPTATPQVVAI